MAPRILNLGSGLVSFTAQPLHPRAKNPRRPLNKMLLGPRSRSGHLEVGEHLLSLSIQDGSVEMATW
jgi:hypothetical protein